MSPCRAAPQMPIVAVGARPTEAGSAEPLLMALPPEAFCDHISPALRPRDLASFACTSRRARELVEASVRHNLAISDGGRALMQASRSGKWALFEDIFAVPIRPPGPRLWGRQAPDCLLRLSGDGRTLARYSPTAALARMDLDRPNPTFAPVCASPEGPRQRPTLAFAISHDAAVAAVLAADGHLSLISTCLAEPGFVAVSTWPVGSAAAAHPACTAYCDHALGEDGRQSRRYDLVLNGSATVVALWDSRPCLLHSPSAADTLWRWAPLSDVASQPWST